MKVTILDGYVDEPSNFGVPPFLSPYPRYLAGAITEAGHTWEYLTIEQVRNGLPLKGNLLAVISGPIVPGKYLRSLPMSEKEMLHHGKAFEGEVVLGGPLARFRAYDERLLEVFDGIAIRDFDSAVYDWLGRGDFSHRDRTMAEWDRWASLGAEVAKHHPDFPQPLIADPRPGRRPHRRPGRHRSAPDLDARRQIAGLDRRLRPQGARADRAHR